MSEGRDSRLTEESKSISDLHEHMPNESLTTMLMCQHEFRQITPFAVVVIHFQLVVMNDSPAFAIEDPGVIWDDILEDVKFQRSSTVLHPPIVRFTHDEVVVASSFAKPAEAIAALSENLDLSVAL